MPALTQRIARVSALGWSAVDAEPPHLTTGDRTQIARRAREGALVAIGHDPRGPAEIARALGIRIHRLAVPGCGGECSDRDRIIYTPTHDPSLRRLRIAHGLAHALLMRESWEHSETDAILLTLDLA